MRLNITKERLFKVYVLLGILAVVVVTGLFAFWQIRAAVTNTPATQYPLGSLVQGAVPQAGVSATWTPPTAAPPGGNISNLVFQKSPVLTQDTAGNIKINGQDICLADGTHCPTSSGGYTNIVANVSGTFCKTPKTYTGNLGGLAGAKDKCVEGCGDGYNIATGITTMTTFTPLGYSYVNKAVVMSVSGCFNYNIGNAWVNKAQNANLGNCSNFTSAYGGNGSWCTGGGCSYYTASADCQGTNVYNWWGWTTCDQSFHILCYHP